MFSVALCQTKVALNMDENIQNAYDKIAEASKMGASIAALGEMFNCPYSGDYFSDYAEEEGKSRAVKMLRDVSRKYGIYVVGGSIPEKENGQVYNTSYVLNPKGEICGKHRKIHLFDVDIKGGIRFKESDYLSSGDKITIFDTPYGKAGVCICYDIRFPELIRSMALMGAEIVFVPAAFNLTTGPVHWHTLFKARAMDNQVYMLGISPARDYDGVYKAYGHSIAVNPWGEVICEAGEPEEIILANIDLRLEKKIREELPLLKHRKPEIYINSR